VLPYSPCTAIKSPLSLGPINRDPTPAQERGDEERKQGTERRERREQKRKGTEKEKKRGKP
jgi:hypothetical protein